MDDDLADALPAQGRLRRAGDGAPALRGVVDALIDGVTGPWDACEPLGRTPLEQRMTRQVRALAALAASPGVRATPFERGFARVVSLARTCLRLRASSAIAALRGADATALAALAADLHRARSPREVAAALMAHVPQAVASPLVAVVTPDVIGWRALAGVLPVLPADSAIASLLAAAEDVIRVDPASSVFPLLPAPDREWLARAQVATLVPLASPAGQPLAGLLMGPREDGGPHTRHDRACLAAASSMGAVALGACTGYTARRPADDGGDGDLSFECVACGRVCEQGDPCPCGGARQLAALPSRLHGAFDVQRRIGQGGMGVVYLAHDTRLDRLVALKTLSHMSPGCVEAFRAEARAMAAVEHPQVAVLYGLEDWRGTPILVVEYLPGGTLATRLASGPLDLAEAVRLGASIADALGALHERGWLHRDIKPSNIGFGRGGGPKLLDFGLTRWTQGAPANMADAPRGDDAEAGGLAGTPLYLSPDALDGEPAGQHDDVWALGVVLVEMLTGRHPFAAPSRAGVLARVRQRAPLDARVLGPTVPPALADVLARTLHPLRSQRIAAARPLAAALRALDRAS